MHVLLSTKTLVTPRSDRDKTPPRLEAPGPAAACSTLSPLAQLEIATQGSGDCIRGWRVGTSGSRLERAAWCAPIGRRYLLEPIGEGDGPQRMSETTVWPPEPGLLKHLGRTAPESLIVNRRPSPAISHATCQHHAAVQSPRTLVTLRNQHGQSPRSDTS
jgi:hypothetical protein